MKKYFKADSEIEVNIGDNVAFVRNGEFNGLRTYTKIEGPITPDNVGDLVDMGYLEVHDVEPMEPANKECKCAGSDYDLDKLIASLEKVSKILAEYIG